MLKSTHRPTVAPPLPAGWTEHKAPTGHPYYYNAATGESTYARPLETQQLPVNLQQSIGPRSGELPDTTNTGYFNEIVPGSAGFNHHPFTLGNGYRERGPFRGGQSRQQRLQSTDRPKSRHPIPGCEPWLLVYTKLGRRFVHNPEEVKSFWKFPPDVMKGVVEYDRVQRDTKVKKEREQILGINGEESFGAAEELLVVESNAPTVAPAPIACNGKTEIPEEESEEYEEVEVTDEEDAENPSKRQKTGEENPDQPVEFNEDDIAYQLAAMGQDYGLDPGEYGAGEGEDLEEGAEGLALTEADSSALFKDMLNDHHINPYSQWDKVIEASHIIEDDRYLVLPNMRSRKEVWGEWSRERILWLKERREKQEKKDPLIPYLSFLQTQATPKLYWPEFRRKYKKEPAMRDVKLSDKEREKWYRDYINRLKLPETTLKADLVSVLKSTPLRLLNRSTTLETLPPPILTDLRYISLHPSIRDPMIETHIASLARPPDNMEILPEEEEARMNERQERERREKALSERQRQVQEERKRQRGRLQASKGILREGEEEVQRAMRVGKEGLRGYMEAAVNVEKH